jgi:hypothetical protein
MPFVPLRKHNRHIIISAMNTIKTLLLGLTFVPSGFAADQPANLVLVNGRVVTFDPALPRAEASCPASARRSAAPECSRQPRNSPRQSATIGFSEFDTCSTGPSLLECGFVKVESS